MAGRQLHRLSALRVAKEVTPVFTRMAVVSICRSRIAVRAHRCSGSN
jgi:hypothetical protein